jgi:hypothetical protein
MFASSLFQFFVFQLLSKNQRFLSYTFKGTIQRDLKGGQKQFPLTSLSGRAVKKRFDLCDNFKEKMFQPNHSSQHRTARKESQDKGQPGKGAKTGQIGQNNQGMTLRTGQPGKEKQDRTARNGNTRTGQPGHDSQEREPRQDSQDRTARLGLPRHDRTVKNKKNKTPIKGFYWAFF